MWISSSHLFNIYCSMLRSGFAFIRVWRYLSAGYFEVTTSTGVASSRCCASATESLSPSCREASAASSPRSSDSSVDSLSLRR